MVKTLTEGFELKSTETLNDGGVLESDVLGMDLSYDVKKGVANYHGKNILAIFRNIMRNF